jgi:putative ABC transport system permease protein
MPYSQHAYNNSTLNVVIRTVAGPAALAQTVGRLATEVSPDVPVSFTTMDTTVSKGLEDSRFRALLFGVFAGLAVCLAMAGVYGVMAYAVEQRSKEIGLRMALGASSHSVSRLILKQGLILTTLGLAFGLAGAAACTRLLTTMLFEVQPNDPWVYLAVAVLLAVVTLLAGYVPARRASNVDPLTALRQE